MLALLRQRQDLVGDGLDPLADVGHPDGRILNGRDAFGGDAIGLTGGGGDGFGKVSRVLGRNLDLLYGRGCLGDGGDLRPDPRRMLGHGRQDGLACAEQVVGAGLDLDHQVAVGRVCAHRGAGAGAIGPHSSQNPEGAQGQGHQGQGGEPVAQQRDVHRSSIG